MSQLAARKAWNEAMKATAGATALPASLQAKQKRRSGRNKKQERRDKARKVLNHSGQDSREYRAAVWIDALEGVDPLAAAPEEDDEYNEIEELDDKKRASKRRKKGKAAGVLPKRFMPKQLATILVEEANREDGASRAFLKAEARLPKSQQVAVRKFCPVSGTEALYSEPKSGIPYSSLTALEQIRERAPPWMTLGGSAAYLEAVKSIRDE